MTAVICPICGLGNDIEEMEGRYDWDLNCCYVCRDEDAFFFDEDED